MQPQASSVLVLHQALATFSLETDQEYSNDSPCIVTLSHVTVRTFVMLNGKKQEIETLGMDVPKPSPQGAPSTTLLLAEYPQKGEHYL
jgi:hypothetical protein